MNVVIMIVLAIIIVWCIARLAKLKRDPWGWGDIGAQLEKNERKKKQ